MSQFAVSSSSPQASSERTLCAHCDLPVPLSLIDTNANRQFCCHACQTVYSIIQSHNLDRYYDLRQHTATTPAKPASIPDASHAHYDDDAFTSRHVSEHPDGTRSTGLYLENVHCPACVWLLEKLPRIAPGVIEARLDYARSHLTVRWDPSAIPLSRIAAAIESLGYPTHPAKDASAHASRKREDRRSLIRIAAAGACAGNVMLLAIALYSGAFTSIDPRLATLFRVISAALTLVCVAWPGRVFFTGALAAIRARTWHLDMPISIAIALGLAASLTNTIRNTGEVYFDSITALIFLLLVGRWLQTRQNRRAADAVELLYSMTPSRVHLVQDDCTVRDAPIDALAQGMTVQVREGESIPADGTITLGSATINRSILTGESTPIPATISDHVAAGTIVSTGLIHVLADSTGADTRLGKLMATLEHLARTKPPYLGAANRIAGIFVTIVLTLAAITFAIHAPTSIAAATEHAVALLIVTCPCALALATPLATSIAIGKAARKGLLIKGGHVLEQLATPTNLVLDKTGTLTLGSFDLVSVQGRLDTLTHAAIAEHFSTHPIAQAITRAAPPLTPDTIASTTHLRTVTGHGIEVEHQQLGRIAVGTEHFLTSAGYTPNPTLSAAAQHAATQGLTPVLVATSNHISGLITLGDQLRPEAAHAIQTLTAAGHTPHILSGDHPGAVSAIAAQLNIPPNHAQGRASPEDKLARIESLQRSATTVMVGDGVNDAPALARASVGIAVSGGTEASLAAADVYIHQGDLTQLPALFAGSRRACRTIKATIAVSLTYNAVAATLAMLGLISPLAAALIMPASSLTVLAIAIRSRTF